MNEHIKKILRNLDPELSLLENVALYVESNKSILDFQTMGEIIKEDKIFYEQLLIECRDKKMLKIEAQIQYESILDLFKEE